jgi:hypothetical protein
MKRIMVIILTLLFILVMGNDVATAADIDTSDQDGIETAEVEETEVEYAFHGIAFDAITQRKLNLRDGDGEIICLIPAGHPLKVLGIADDDPTRAVVTLPCEKFDIMGTVWLNYIEPAPEQKHLYALVKANVGLNQRNEEEEVIDFLDYGTVVSMSEDLEESSTSEERAKVELDKEGSVLKSGLTGTFVLVDKSDQVMYYFQDQKLVVFGPCVTGNVEKNMDTPTGVFEVLSRQKDYKMKKRYQTHFAFRYYEGYFLHDAPWRGEKDNFGGSTYKYGGSHGCVNLPYETAQFLWEGDENFSYLQEGTPVVVQD